MSKTVKVTDVYINAAIAQLKSVRPMKLASAMRERIVDTTQFTRVLLNYPIEKLLGLLSSGKVKPHKRQRNHKRDVAEGRSEHVCKGVSLSHTELVLSFWKDQWDFVDGNHRTEFWANYTRGKMPSHVNLVCKFPRNEDEYIGLFFQYDSSQAHKNNSDHLEGILNSLGLLDKMQSPMFQDGAFWGMAWRLAGSKDLTSVLHALKAHEDALMKLDSHKFRASHLPMGAMLAAVELYHAEEELLVFKFLVDFRTAYAAGIKKSKSGISSVIPEAENLIDDLLAYSKDNGKDKPVSGYGLTGEPAVLYVRNAVHDRFEEFKVRIEDERKLFSKTVKGKKARAI